MLESERNYSGLKEKHAVIDMSLESWLMFRADQSGAAFPEWFGWKYYYEDEHLAIEGRSLCHDYLKEYISQPLLDMAAELAFDGRAESGLALMLETSAYSAAHAVIDKDPKLAVKDAESGPNPNP
jgi:hypothetical protein